MHQIKARLMPSFAETCHYFNNILKNYMNFIVRDGLVIIFINLYGNKMHPYDIGAGNKTYPWGHWRGASCNPF